MSEICAEEYNLVALDSTYPAHSRRHYCVNGITDLVVERTGRPALVVRHHEGLGA